MTPEEIRMWAYGQSGGDIERAEQLVKWVTRMGAEKPVGKRRSKRIDWTWEADAIIREDFASGGTMQGVRLRLANIGLVVTAVAVRFRCEKLGIKRNTSAKTFINTAAARAALEAKRAA